MTCMLCSRFSDEIICTDCHEKLKASLFSSLFPSRCPVCGKPLWDEAYPCMWCVSHVAALCPEHTFLADVTGYCLSGSQKPFSLELARYLKTTYPDIAYCSPYGKKNHTAAVSILRKTGWKHQKVNENTFFTPVLTASLFNGRTEQMRIYSVVLASDCVFR